MGQTQPELWLLLNAGFKPKKLISLGYKKYTVYYYNRKFPLIKQKYQKIINAEKELLGLK
jgi:hypothetical protein